MLRWWFHTLWQCLTRLNRVMSPCDEHSGLPVGMYDHWNHPLTNTVVYHNLPVHIFESFRWSPAETRRCHPDGLWQATGGEWWLHWSYMPTDHHGFGLYEVREVFPWGGISVIFSVCVSISSVCDPLHEIDLWLDFRHNNKFYGVWISPKLQTMVM